MKSRVLLFLFFTSFIALAQTDSVNNQIAYKNIIKFNPTPTAILSGNALVFGYERVLKNNSSFSINAGYIALPKFGANAIDSLKIEGDSKRRGFSISADYRMYFKRNKYSAPDGLYWGPYITNYNFTTNANLVGLNNNAVKGDLELNSKVNLLFVGAQLGYQFTLGKKRRWTIDLIFMGPSVSFNKFQIELNGDVDVNKESEYVQGAYDAIVKFFPGFKELTTQGSFDSKGVAYVNSVGFRYLFQIGYRF